MAQPQWIPFRMASSCRQSLILKFHDVFRCVQPMDFDVAKHVVQKRSQLISVILSDMESIPRPFPISQSQLTIRGRDEASALVGKYTTEFSYKCMVMRNVLNCLKRHNEVEAVVRERKLTSVCNFKSAVPMV